VKTDTRKRSRAIVEEMDSLAQAVMRGQPTRWDAREGRKDIEMEIAPKGLSEDTIRLISEKKGEPEWLLDLFAHQINQVCSAAKQLGTGALREQTHG